jgi:very-short-patch-repair endonuclease
MLLAMFEHDERLARWFAANGEVVRVSDAARIGVPPEAIKRRARAGVLTREQHGVYRPASVPAAFEIALRAAISAAGDNAFVSGHSLMRTYGTRGCWSDSPEITLLGTEHLVLPGVRIRRIDRIERRDVHRRNGLPVLAPPLGLLTLGASATARQVEVAVHDMVFQGFTALPQLIDVVKRYGGRGRRGARAFRAGVRSLDPDGRATQTNMELKALRAVRAAGFPDPQLQFRVLDGDGRRRRLDLAWPDLLLDLETDGDRWHTSRSDRAAMHVRDAAMRAIGYDVVRVDSDDVEHDLPGVIARLRPFFGIWRSRCDPQMPKNEGFRGARG